MRGQIIKSMSGEYSVFSDGQITVCKPLGIFRHREIAPKVGDWVTFNDGIIEAVEDRKNDFIRPNIANVDKVFIITSLIEPNLNLNLLDRLISIVEWYDIRLVLVFTKADLVEMRHYQVTLDYYQALGYPVYVMPGDAHRIQTEIANEVCVVAGQSGVGKSSMINALNETFHIKTAAISYALGRGKHTTRHVELLPVGQGWIADTPGFGILDLEMDIVSLSHTFREFFSTTCRFSQCVHLHEPGCGVKQKVASKDILPSRYESYLSFVEEIKNQKKY